MLWTKCSSMSIYWIENLLSVKYDFGNNNHINMCSTNRKTFEFMPFHSFDTVMMIQISEKPRYDAVVQAKNPYHECDDISATKHTPFYFQWYQFFLGILGTIICAEFTSAHQFHVMVFQKMPLKRFGSMQNNTWFVYIR